MTNKYPDINRTGHMRTMVIPSKPTSFTVSRIVLGTAQYGTRVPEDTAYKLMDSYYSEGGTTIDTANIYGRWGSSGESLSEKCIGHWVNTNGLRSKVQIITKGCHPDLSTMSVPRVGAEYIKKDIAESIYNLQTDYIDIYQLHNDDPKVAVAEIMECLHEYVKKGCVRAVSASNWTTTRIKEANDYARSSNFTEFSSSEINRSLAVLTPNLLENSASDITEDDLDFYKQSGVPIFAWGSLGGGYIINGVKGTLDKVSQVFKNKFQNEQSDRRIENVKRVMSDTGLTVEELCITYLTSQEIPIAAIIGVEFVDQIAPLMKASDLLIPMEMIRDLEM